jgi:mRNA-degrading endonuclease RelE of RelBE toxin-antitoxin system
MANDGQGEQVRQSLVEGAAYPAAIEARRSGPARSFEALVESHRSRIVRSAEKKIAGDDRYRIRQGDHRIVYLIEDAVVTVTIVRVARQAEVLRR